MNKKYIVRLAAQERRPLKKRDDQSQDLVLVHSAESRSGVRAAMEVALDTYEKP